MLGSRLLPARNTDIVAFYCYHKGSAALNRGASRGYSVVSGAILMINDRRRKVFP